MARDKTERAEDDEERARRGAIALSRNRLLVIAISLVLACAICVPVMVLTNDLRPFDDIGFLATVWAFILAVVIYLLTADKTDARLEDTDVAKGQLLAFYDADDKKQSDEELDAAMERFQDYVDALIKRYPMPQTAITYIARGPQIGQERNRPVLVRTRRGREYSVFHGGRMGTYSITKLKSASGAI